MATDQLSERLISLIDKNTPGDGLFETRIEGLFVFRDSEPYGNTKVTYAPGLVFAAQGRKHVYLEDKQYDYVPGHFIGLFAPLPVECEVTEASAEKPLLGAGLYLDKNKLARLLLKMESFAPPLNEGLEIDPSAIFSAPLKDQLLDAMVRLIASLDSPSEAAILGDSIIEEIYFRLLGIWREGELLHLLQHQGQIREISKVVDYIHQHIGETISVDDMARVVNMSASNFHKKFRQVMHMSPLQYAKSVKLNKAHDYIVDGKNASEAGLLVGYTSPAQFSREYKRHFGVAPSRHKAIV